MTGLEPRTSGIGSNHSTNWATTTAQQFMYRYVNAFIYIVGYLENRPYL